MTMVVTMLGQNLELRSKKGEKESNNHTTTNENNDTNNHKDKQANYNSHICWWLPNIAPPTGRTPFHGR